MASKHDEVKNWELLHHSNPVKCLLGNSQQMDSLWIVYSGGLRMTTYRALLHNVGLKQASRGLSHTYWISPQLLVLTFICSSGNILIFPYSGFIGSSLHRAMCKYNKHKKVVIKALKQDDFTQER